LHFYHLCLNKASTASGLGYFVFTLTCLAFDETSVQQATPADTVA